MEPISPIEQYVIDKVREKRQEAGITQVVLSGLLDLSPKYVANVESGKTRLKYNLNHLDKIAHIFECSVKDFLPNKSLYIRPKD